MGPKIQIYYIKTRVHIRCGENILSAKVIHANVPFLDGIDFYIIIGTVSVHISLKRRKKLAKSKNTWSSNLGKQIQTTS